jgi:hypothetical protein
LRLIRWQLKVTDYEYEVVYKARRINANADAPSRNPVSDFALRVSGKSDSSESLFPAVNPTKRGKVRKNDTISDNETEEIRPENSIRLTKTNNDTEAKYNESPSGDIDINADTRLNEPSSSFSGNPQEGNKHINSDIESEDESVSEEPIFDKIY